MATTGTAALGAAVQAFREGNAKRKKGRRVKGFAAKQRRGRRSRY